MNQQGRGFQGFRKIVSVALHFSDCRVLHNGAGDQRGLSFMHQDRLGSALVITDKGGLILGSNVLQAEFRTFDAFGKARDNQALDSLKSIPLRVRVR